MIEAIRNTDEGCLVDAFRAVVGEAHVLTRPEDVEGYLTDWTGQYRATAVAVVRPATTREVAELVKLCSARNFAVVPQGGRTGLCGGG